MVDESYELDESYDAFIAQRRQEILLRVDAACKRAGRDMSEIELLAVSKTVDSHAVATAYTAGWRLFGENRPQELSKKVQEADANPITHGVRFDMIGNLQTNKINQVLKSCSQRSSDWLIHSISSLHLAEAVSKRALALQVPVPKCLLEVNVLGEASKSGFSPDELLRSQDALLSLPGIQICGLMGMAPAHKPQAAREHFSKLRELQNEFAQQTGLVFKVLSCGMSDDFETAIEEGSTLLRLGRIVFAPEYDLQ